MFVINGINKNNDNSSNNNNNRKTKKNIISLSETNTMWQHKQVYAFRCIRITTEILVVYVQPNQHISYTISVHT
jgi:hypothetical protein